MTCALIAETILRGLRQSPHAPAVIEDLETASYSQLWNRAAELANVLRMYGVHRGDRVALLLPKGIDAVVAVYGALLAGAIYVPLDVRSPISRLQKILLDADCAALISTLSLSCISSALAEFPHGDCKMSSLRLINLPFCGVDHDVNGAYSENPDYCDAVFDDSSAPAAILYTSGTTGTPKGVVLTHAGLLHFSGWMSRFFGLKESDRIASIAPLQFDLSTFDLFATHRVGAAVVLLGERTLLFPRAVLQSFESYSVTICYSVPTFWALLLEHGGLQLGGLRSLRHVMFAGEVFPLSALRRLIRVLPHARFTNLFGPLETNVCSLYMLPAIPTETEAEIPIGVACADTVLHVVGEDGHTVGPGEVGELIVSGPSVTPGYWRNPLLTQQKRWHGDPSSFCTGDLVTYNQSGQLMFCGRRDHQVKLNGYRIELFEIEQVFQRHPDVVQAVALLTRNEVGRGRLVVLVKRRAGAVSAEALQRFAAGYLPSWSQPAQVVFRGVFPTTVSGKTDRLQLQADLESNPSS